MPKPTNLVSGTGALPQEADRPVGGDAGLPPVDAAPTRGPAHAVRAPLLFVLTLYIPFGILDYGLKVALPSNLFKLLGFSNEEIGLLSGIGLIASLRWLVAPWLDALASKRTLSLFSLAIAGLLAVVAAGILYAPLERDVFLWSMVACLFGFAIMAAVHETASDGYYIRALDASRQAEFIGIKTAAIRGGIIFSMFALLLLATKVAASYGAVDVESPDKTGFNIGFALAYALAAAVFFTLAVVNIFAVQKIPNDQPVRHDTFALAEVLRDYFLQRRVALMILLFLLYRFGQGLLDTMKSPFYLDPVGDGGLQMEATAMPYFSLLSDMPWMIVGGIFGGLLIKWFGLKRTFIPLTLFMNLPNLAYVWLASSQPQAALPIFGESLNTAVLAVSSLESLGYGLSFSAMFYFMHIMATEAGKNKTAILAVSLAIMNVGWLGPGMMSGFIQAELGYTGLFLLSSFVGLVVLVIIPFLPMPQTQAARSGTSG